MLDTPISVPAPLGPGRLGAWASVGLSLRQLASAAVTVLLVLGAWVFLTPPQVGGATTYVVVSGTSMLPHFHAGDLVLLRKEPTYRVGEVAGYHSDLGVVVMHRIVAEHDGHFVFKGDNNNFVDTYEPTKAQIVGAEWVHASGAGRFLAGLRNPIVSASLLGTIWIVSFSAERRTRRQRRRHRHGR